MKNIGRALAGSAGPVPPPLLKVGIAADKRIANNNNKIIK